MHNTPSPLNGVVTEAFNAAGVSPAATANRLGIHAKTASRRFKHGTLTVNDLEAAAALTGTTPSELQARAGARR